MNILIPMAGEGSRFKAKGYKLPKPLIDVGGKPMIQRVIKNLSFEARYIFLIRKSHIESIPDLSQRLASMCSPNKCKVVVVDSLTEGAACTALLAKRFINSSEDLLIANSDQLIEFSKHNFLKAKSNPSNDGIVFTFHATESKWSFVKVENGLVVQVAEKEPISDIATCGIYWYRKGSDFVKYAESMISDNVRVKNEFYIAPVYNYLIKDSKRLVTFNVEKMHGLGTPEDLEVFLNDKTDML